MLKLYCCDISEISDEEYLRMYAMCDTCRKEKIERLQQDPAKKLSAAAGMLARIGIGQALGIDPHTVSIRRGKNGKPYAQDLDIHFSLSHSGNLAVCAISDCPVGIDVERMRKVDYRVAQKWFTVREQYYIFSEKRKQEKRFFEIWTKKEAYVKRIGTGISDFSTFDVWGDKSLHTIWKDRYAISVSQSDSPKDV